MRTFGRHVALFISLISQPALTENNVYLASPISPGFAPKVATNCLLDVYVSEFPSPGKYYMYYTVRPNNRKVTLSIGARSTEIPASEEYKNGLGQIFDPINPLQVKSVSATVQNGNHCEGSPFSVRKHINQTVRTKIYKDLFFRDPQADELTSDWVTLSSEERAKLVGQLQSSQERRMIELNSYQQQYLQQPLPLHQVTVLATSQLTSSELITRILSSPNYFQRVGQTHDRFVYFLYNDLLSRAPTAEESKLLLTQLDRFGIRRNKIVEFVLKSKDFRTRLVQAWWNGYYQRIPNEIEQNETLKKLDSGESWETIQKSLIASDEYYQRSIVTR